MGEPKIFERRPAAFLVAAAVAVQGLALAHELAIGRVNLNDNVFHLTLIERTVETLAAGANPFDFWVSEWSFGYPVPRTPISPSGTWRWPASTSPWGRASSW